jgi:thymidylate synthase (FAD)
MNPKWSRREGEFDDNPLLRDVAFNKDSINAGSDWRHVSPLAEDYVSVGVDGIKVKLLQGLPPKEQIAKVLGRALNATTGYNLESEDVDTSTEWQDLLRGGLQAVMEAFVIVFEVSGVSRACTHQIVRSRRAGFHQQSQRATRYAKPGGAAANVRVPESVWRAMSSNEGLAFAYEKALEYAALAYEEACAAGVSYQDARYILPEGTENYIMCEYTLREFLAVHDYRACSMFNWEIVHVVREMGRLLKIDSPWIIGTGAEPKISCERTHSAIDGSMLGHACTFQGWEQVEGQCGLPWAREGNRTFKPSESLRIKRSAGSEKS